MNLLKQRLYSLLLAVVMCTGFMLPLQSYAAEYTGEYTVVEADKNLTRFELSEKNFKANTVRRFEFTPQISGNYGFYYGNMIWSGDTKPTLNMQVLAEDETISLYSKVCDKDIEGEIPEEINFGSAPYGNIKPTTVAENGANGSWVKTDGTPNAVYSYKCNCRIGTRTKYVRIGDKLSLYAQLEAGKQYVITFETSDVDFTLDYIDVKNLSIPLSGKNIQIPILDFSDFRSLGAAYNFGKYPLQNLSSEENVQYSKNADIIGNYNSDMLRDNTTPGLMTNGAAVYTLNVSKAGKYSFTAHMNSRTSATQDEVDSGKIFNLQAAMNIAKVTDGTVESSLIKNEWGGIYSNNTDEKDDKGNLISKETKVYYDTVTYTAELEEGIYNFYCYFNPSGGRGLLYNLTVNYMEDYAVNADDNFIKIPLGNDAKFETGLHMFDFTPSANGDYAFYFDKLSYEEAPQITLSVLNGNVPVNLEYKEDIAYTNENDSSKNTTANGIYEYRETLSTDYTKGTSHICNIEKKNYYRVADKLSLHTSLKKGVKYTLCLNVKGAFTLPGIDIRRLTVLADGTDCIISVLDFTDYSLSQEYGNDVYPFTYYTQWNWGQGEVEYFPNDCKILGDYRSEKLVSRKTSANPYISGKMTYNLDVTVPGEYTLTAYIRSSSTVKAGESIHDNATKQNGVSGWWGIVQDGVSNKKNAWYRTYMKNNSDKDAYVYGEISQTFTLSEGQQDLIFRIDNDSIQVDYFKIDYKPYNEIVADEDFSRFEFDENERVFSAAQQTKSMWFTPQKDGSYALYAGPMQNIGKLSFDITDEDGNAVAQGLSFSGFNSNTIQRVEPNKYNAYCFELSKNKKYRIDVTASEMTESSLCTLDYLDIRRLTKDVGYKPAVISMFDYTSIAQDGNNNHPNNSTEKNKTYKWSDLKVLPSGNYMYDGLSAKNEYAFSASNPQLKYALDFCKSGKYKVTVYAVGDGANIDVSIGGKSCGTVVVKGSTLCKVQCPNVVSVDEGILYMTVSQTSNSRADILGVKIENVDEADYVKFSENMWTNDNTSLMAKAYVNNNGNDNIKLYAAQYDNDERLVGIDEFSDYLTDNDEASFNIECKPDAKKARMFLWGDKLNPIADDTSIEKFCGAVLRVGSGEEYSSFEEAFEAARSLIRDGDVCIALSGGEYILNNAIELGEEFSGEHTLTVTSLSSDSRAKISGARHIDGSFEPYQNGIYRVKVPEDLKSRQLFVDGIRAVRARSKGPLENCEKVKLKDGTWVFSTTDDLSKIINPGVLECVFHEDWKSQRVIADGVSYNTDIGKWTITFNGASKSVWKSLLSSYKAITTPDWIENSLSLLDEPGEWYLDEREHYLYYMPRPFENIENIDVVMPVTEKLFVGEGTSDMPINNITFKNVEFSDTGWLKPSTDRAMHSGQNELDDKISNTGCLIDGAIEFNNVNNVNFVECTFTHMGSIAVKMIGAVQNCTIEKSEFYDLSASAIAIGEVGVEAEIRNPSEEKCIKNITISDNYIRKIGVDYHSSAAIGLGYLKDSVVKNNEICDGKYSGIHYGYGWKNTSPVITKNLVIKDNYLHDLMNAEPFDGGAIYVLGTTNGSEGMNYITGNYVVDMKQPAGCLYPDEGSCYWTVENNVVDEYDFKKNQISKNGFWPEMKWLNPWARELHHIYASNNYSTFTRYTNGGYPTFIDAAYVYEDGRFPEKAFEIIKKSGVKNTEFGYGLQKVSVEEDFSIAKNETKNISIDAFTSKGSEYDLDNAQIYSFCLNENVARLQGTEVTGVSKGETEAVIYIVTMNKGRKELYSFRVNITVS